MNVKLQPSKDSFIQFTDDQLESLGFKVGDKFSVTVDENKNILLTPFCNIDIDLNEFSREVLEMLIKISCEQDISMNEVISNILKEMIQISEKKI